MEKIVNKTVKLTLVGLDGNAYALMGAFQRAAKKQDWTKEEIDKVLTECRSGDYNHLLATLAAHCEDREEDWDYDNYDDVFEEYEDENY